MARAAGFGERPAPPPSLLFDQNSDSAETLWRRLHDRFGSTGSPRLILHLKNGTTRIGNLQYYDRSLIAMHVGGNRIEIWVKDIAHVIVPGKQAED